MRERQEDRVKKAFVWFGMLSKRQLKKISLYVILAVMIICGVLIKYVADNFTVTIEIGVVNDDDGNVAKRIEEALLNHRGLVVFLKFESEEELKEAVSSGEVMGGYILQKEFSKNILTGETDKTIKSLATPNSLISSVSDEMFFSFVMKEISYEELVKDTMDTGYFFYLSEEEIREDLREYFDVNLSNGSTFHIEYDREDDEFARGSFSIDIYDYISPIIKGIVGLMIFIAGLCGTISYYEDREKGSLVLLKKSGKLMVSLLETAIPVLVVTATGIVTLIITNMETGIYESIVKYIIYALLTMIYCMLLKLIIRRKAVFVSMIPVFILMSVVFCPIFINLETLAPGLGVLGKFLPLNWLYLL